MERFKPSTVNETRDDHRHSVRLDVSLVKAVLARKCGDA